MLGKIGEALVGVCLNHFHPWPGSSPKVNSYLKRQSLSEKKLTLSLESNKRLPESYGSLKPNSASWSRTQLIWDLRTIFLGPNISWGWKLFCRIKKDLFEKEKVIWLNEIKEYASETAKADSDIEKSSLKPNTAFWDQTERFLRPIHFCLKPTNSQRPECF